jgi:hypothetical protein
MSRTAHKLLSASGGKAYEIGQSLVFDRGDGAYLVRAAADITDGNHTTFTYSTWFKRVQTGSNDIVFNVRASNGAGVTFMVYIPGTEQALYVFQKDSGGNTLWYLETNRKLRDVGAWYHIVVAVDTTQSTASDRVKIYINGTQETSFTGSSSYPDEDLVTPVNDGVDHQIGYNAAASLDGYMAETYLIDGTAQAASAFGETDSETNAWIPKKYGGAYGTNGFYLKYVSGAIGTDSSGEGNNYTANNLANADVMLDTPTNNFATLNPLGSSTTHDITQGNLQAKGSDANNHHKLISTIAPTSGKWYCEYYVIQVQRNSTNIGASTRPEGAVVDSSNQNGISLNDETTWRLNYHTDDQYTAIYRSSNKEVGNLDDAADGDICSIAIDADNSKVYFRRNNTIVGSSDGYTINTLEGGDRYFFAFYPRQKSSYRGYGIVNFGQNSSFAGYKSSQGNTDDNGVGDFYYSPPSGYKALCTKNLPDPTIKKPTEHFDTVTYTGNDSNRNITSFNFQPDFLWLKSRETAYYHRAIDAVRGSTRSLYVNTNDSELVDDYGTVGGFLSNGFSLRAGAGSNATHAGTNADGDDMVAWAWKANGSGSANTDGATNTTATSANTTAGFSIINVVGTGSSTTYGHGLGVVPKVYIVKLTSGTGDWYLQTSALDGGWDYLQLNTTAASNSMSATAPTSSVITGNITSSATAVYYAFAEVEGFSKFGSYTGNASTDGPYVYTGFRPAFILFKDVNTTESWNLFDNKRNPYNLGQNFMWADLASGDYVSGSNGIDLLSNGFKIRANNGVVNGSTNTWLYMAFAEAPFKYANAR